MIYGYIRVSTDKQTVESQRFEVTGFTDKNAIKIDEWIEETISGAKEPNKRKLGRLLSKLQKGDTLICTELSRLGRSLLMVMAILNDCMTRGIQVWTIKDNYRLGNDITSKVLAFAFGLCAEIERDMVSKRTKEALKLKRAQGVVLGRPKGRKSSHVKLTGQEERIRAWLAGGRSKSWIARRTGVHRITLGKFVSERMGKGGAA